MNETVYYYEENQPVMPGDIIQYATSPACIEAILQPNSQEAIAFKCPNGGILISTDQFGFIAIEQPDQTDWDEIQLIKRA
ncbi:hypothetical protein JD969_14650 [Planctomycetota bacterium]|nr:hypothetical protein JD969_14650 [Planctomycetota bacterium]